MRSYKIFKGMVCAVLTGALIGTAAGMLIGDCRCVAPIKHRVKRMARRACCAMEDVMR